jgi:ubiquinone/menaquinone biosynthesis C-methylase UbiE
MDVAAIPDKTLAECLAMVERVFDSEEIATRRIDVASVAEYYQQSDRGYRIFHSADGALHLALNYEGEFQFDGYSGQAAIVQEHLQQTAAARVLEAGCGNGFNCICLGRQNPDLEIVGVDLTDEHVAAARKAAAGLGNVRFEQGNVEHLPHGDDSFDMAFAVECLCQTDDLRQALAEIHRVLRPGGRLVVIDCYRNRPLDEFSDDLQLAARLVEKTTAVDNFVVVDGFIELAESVGFRQHDRTDLSGAVAHNLDRLYGLARRFFNMRAGVWAMKKTFGTRLLENAVCGLLMPFTVGNGVHGYYGIVVQKVE